MAVDVTSQSLNVANIPGNMGSWFARHLNLDAGLSTIPDLGGLGRRELQGHQPDAQELSSWSAVTPRKTIEINKAWLRVKSLIPQQELDVYMQSGECVQCPLWKEGRIEPEGSLSMLVPAHTETSLAITNASQPEQLICSGKHYFDERGDYWLTVSHNATQGACNLTLINTPPNVFLPILWACLVLVAIAVAHQLVSYVHTSGALNRCRPGYQSQDLQHTTLEMDTVSNGKDLSNGTGTAPVAPVAPVTADTPADAPAAETTAPKTAPVPAPRQTTSQRVHSLDAFRGLSLLIMIFVNYGGGGYYFFQHAAWNGLRVADLVFPWFIFIMGTSLELSFVGMAKRGVPKWRRVVRVVRRSALLFLIGISLTTMWGNDLRKLRIPGVLQRFAISYLFVGILHVFFVRIPNQKVEQFGPLRDLLTYWFEWVFMLCLLALHVGFTFGYLVPGCPTGYLGPGGISEGGKYYNCTGGAAGYIDRMLLGNVHIFQWPTIRGVYMKAHPVPFDPEGILGCLTSIFMCFLGLQAGKILKGYTSHRDRISRWIVWGVLTGGIGLVLCKARQDGGWIPLNKNLWSISFIMLLSGMAFLLLVAMYVTMDVMRLWNGAPLKYLGMNSIVVYCCHEIFHGYFPVSWQMPDPSLHWQRLFLSIWGTGVWVVLAYVLYRKRIFVAL